MTGSAVLLSLLWTALLCSPFLWAMGYARQTGRAQVYVLRAFIVAASITLLPWGKLFQTSIPVIDSGRTPGGFEGFCSWLLLLWAAGSVLEAVTTIKGQMKWWKEMAPSPVASGELEETLKGMSGSVRLSSLRLLEAASLQSAAVPLSFRPTLIVSKSGVQDLILRHELAHLKHLDVWWMLAARILTCVFWFHNGFRKLESELALAQEIRADEEAILHGSKTEYARLLLAHSQEPVPIIGSSWGQDFSLTARIAAMGGPQKGSLHGLTIRLAAALLLPVVGLSWSRAEQQQGTKRAIPVARPVMARIASGP